MVQIEIKPIVEYEDLRQATLDFLTNIQGYVDTGAWYLIMPGLMTGRDAMKVLAHIRDMEEKFVYPQENGSNEDSTTVE